MQRQPQRHKYSRKEKGINASRRHQKHISKEQQEKLSAKALEIEEALRIQREKQAQNNRNAAPPIPDVESTETQHSLRGLAYDAKTQRYYKIPRISNPSIGSILNRLTEPNLPPTHSSTPSTACFTSLLRARSRSTTSYQLAYSHLQLYEQVSPFAPFSGHFTSGHFHPRFGLAVTNSSITRIDNIGGNIMSTLGSTMGLRWCEMSEVPLMSIVSVPRNQFHATKALSILNLASGDTTSTQLSHDLCRFDAIVWSRDLSKIVLGTADGLALLSSANLAPISEAPDDAITSITNHSNDILAGLRKGHIKKYDVRLNNKRCGHVVAKMPFCVQNICVMKNDVTVVAQDVTGCIRLYDTRYSRHEVLRIADGDETKVYSGSMYVSCDESVILSTAVPYKEGYSNIVAHHIDSGTCRRLSPPIDTARDTQYRLLHSYHTPINATQLCDRGDEVWGRSVTSSYYGAYAYSVSDPTVLYAVAP